MAKKPAKLAPRTEKSDRRRVFIIDDHSIMCAGIRRLLEAEVGLEVCKEASTAKQALAAVSSERPDLALIDVALPGTDGVELIRGVARTFPVAIDAGSFDV